MANDFNQTTFTGRLGKDPESLSFNNGNSVVSFSIAVGESWRDKQSGERKEKTEWVNVSILNEALGKIATEYLKKGSRVLIQGKQVTRKWQDRDSGADRFMTECVVGPFGGVLNMLDSRADSEQRGGRQEDRNGDERDVRGNQIEGRRAPASTGSLIDDDIPFNCEWR